VPILPLAPGPRVGFCASREEMGDEGWVAGCKSCRVYVVSLIHLGYKVRIAARGEEEI
jgi:hypothetical protein